MRIFLKMMGLLTFGIDTRLEDSFLALGSSALSEEGEMKELNPLSSKLLEWLDLSIRPSDNKFSGGTSEGSKEEFGCWMYESSGHFCCGYLKHRERLVRKADGWIA